MMSFNEFKAMFKDGFYPDGNDGVNPPELYLSGESFGVNIDYYDWPKELKEFHDSMEKDEDGRYSDDDVEKFLSMADESEELWKTAYEKYTEE